MEDALARAWGYLDNPRDFFRFRMTCRDMRNRLPYKCDLSLDELLWTLSRFAQGSERAHAASHVRLVSDEPLAVIEKQVSEELYAGTTASGSVLAWERSLELLVHDLMARSPARELDNISCTMALSLLQGVAAGRVPTDLVPRIARMAEDWHFFPFSIRQGDPCYVDRLAFVLDFFPPKHLLGEESEFEVVASDSQILFQSVACSGSLECLELVMSRYGFNLENDVQMGLFAALGGSVQVMQRVLDSGVPLTENSWEFLSAVHSGNLDLCQFLLQLGSDLHAVYPDYVDDQFTDWSIAFEHPGGHGALHILTAKSPGAQDAAIARMLVSRGLDINQRMGEEDYHFTPIMGALLQGRSDLIPVLEEMGATVSQRDFECCFRDRFELCHRKDAISYLVKHGVNANARVESLEAEYPIFAAIDSWYVELVEVLLELGADVNLRHGEHTPLTYALRQLGVPFSRRRYCNQEMDQQKRIVKRLVDWCPALVNTPTASGSLPLDLLACIQPRNHRLDLASRMKQPKHGVAGVVCW